MSALLSVMRINARSTTANAPFSLIAWIFAMDMSANVSMVLSLTLTRTNVFKFVMKCSAQRIHVATTLHALNFANSTNALATLVMSQTRILEHVAKLSISARLETEPLLLKTFVVRTVSVSMTAMDITVNVKLVLK